MAKKLIISRKAYFDIERIVDFNNTRNQSETYSKKFVKGIFKLFNLLTRQPLIGRRTNRINTYLVVWDQFYIFYNYNGEEIIITSLYHQNEDVDVS